MRIKNIKIENYKSLKNVEIKDLSNFVAFIGPNMAGKSNIFDALWFLHEGSMQNLKYAIEQRGNYEDTVWHKDTSEIIKLELSFNLDEALRDKLLKPLLDKKDQSTQKRIYNSHFLRELRYELRLAFREINPFYAEILSTANIDTAKSNLIIIEKRLDLDGQRCISKKINDLRIQFEKLLKGNDLGMLGSSKPPPWYDDSFKLAFYSDYNRFSEGPEDKIINILFSYIHSWRRLSPYRNIPNATRISSSTILKPSASNLTDIIHTLSSNDPDKFDKILPLLTCVIPDIKRLSTPVTQDTITAGLYEIGQPSSIFYKLSSFSAGIKNVLSIIVLLMASKDNGLVLIEEPEIHLHPSAIRNLVDNVLREHASNKQILFTTHSPTALINFNINNIFLVTRDDTRNTQIEVLSSENVVEVIEQLGIRPSDSLDYDMIIFVEGPYDADIYRVFAKKMNIDANSFCYIPTEGWTSMKYYANASILQKRRVKPNIIAVFDGDIDKKPTAKREKEKMLTKMNIPEENIFSLSLGEIECYLLNIETWYKTWPNLKIAKDELKQKFDEIIKSDKQKEQMEKLMKHLGLGDYTRKTAIKLVDNMSSIPPEIERILEHSKALIEQG